MLTNTTKSPYSKVSPLSWDAVTWTDGFFADAFALNEAHTIPHLQEMFESKDISHVVENFRICAGESQGDFGGTDFGDGDFYKWMEAAIYTAAKTNNKALLSQLDGYIDLIGRAQLKDGYISTKQILGERKDSSFKRFGNINDFEVYNFGHLFTTACLHKRITGKDNFLKIAKSAAAYLKDMYEENARTGKVQTAVCPSHYMGLVEMYRTTSDPQYLALAELAVSLRDSVTDGTDDNQDRTPLKEQEKIVGHAVRSNYLYAGVADLYAETGESSYRSVLSHVWNNLMDSKIYITGGCGALYNGASPYGNFFIHQMVHQAYGYEYQLPNVTAYNETCASIGHVLWAYRMFQIDPRAEYFDAIERSLMNVNLAAVSLDGKKFFYENMLRRAKKLEYELIWPLTRSEYILSYCCPPNLARTIAESSEYAYAMSKDTLYLGVYGSSEASITLENGASFQLTQTTAYPYDGRIELHITHQNGNTPFYINVRIPGWCKKAAITHNNEIIALGEEHAATYYSIAIHGTNDTDIIIDFDLAVRLTVSHNMVEENTNQAAIERGPLVYCMESADVSIDTLDDLFLDLNAKYEPEPYSIAGRNVTALKSHFYRMKRSGYDRSRLYQTLNYQGMDHTDVRLIPYFAWDNRGFGEMRIWFPITYK